MKTIQKKICLLGDFSVGKTSLVRQFVEKTFSDEYLSTVGVKISKKSIELQQDHDEAKLNLLIWDLAGGDDYSKVTSGYLAGAAGILMVCDATRKSTIGMLEMYSNQLKKINKADLPAVLLVNKIDLTDLREIKDEDIEAISEKLQITWHLTSAKTGEGVETGFETLANLIISN